MRTDDNALEPRVGNVVPRQDRTRTLSEIPEEEFWLANQKSPGTAKVYRGDLLQFIADLRIRSEAELRQADHRQVIAWKAIMEKREESNPTICRRLAALSSYFKYLINVTAEEEDEGKRVTKNPVRDVERPEREKRKVKSKTFSEAQARKIMDAPPADKLLGLRDRAVLAVGFQCGARRNEIVKLRIKDFGLNKGYPALFFRRKRETNDWVTIHPETVRRITDYLDAAGHAEDLEGPLFRPVRGNQRQENPRRQLAPERIDALLRKYVRKALGIRSGFRAHSMRATFITVALEKGAPVDAVQDAVGHAQASTTRMYDQRRNAPERSATFYATYQQQDPSE